jgi:hypothetical protein
LSTAAQTQYLVAALKARDRELDQALAQVATEAQQVPEHTLPTLCRESLTGFFAPAPIR